MYIKKPEIMNSLSGVQKRDNDQLIEQERIPLFKSFHGSVEKMENRGNLGLDRIRGQVLNLHEELKEIQTQISNKQIQEGFLSSLTTDPDWKVKLESFMKGHLLENTLINPDSNSDVKTYLSQLRDDIQILSNDMLTREIKMENIISAGLVEAPKADVSDIIIKDMDTAKEIFSRIKKDSISRILKP